MTKGQEMKFDSSQRIMDNDMIIDHDMSINKFNHLKSHSFVNNKTQVGYKL